jgi:GT2 family glycosyltransferase
MAPCHRSLESPSHLILAASLPMHPFAPMSALNVTTRHETHQWLSYFSPDAPVIVIPVFNAIDDAIRCLDSLTKSTDITIPILLLDDCSADTEIQTLEASARKHANVYFARQDKNLGFVQNANTAFTLCERRDVVLVNSDVILPNGWLARLRDAAYSRQNVATATPLTNHGSLLSVPHRNTPSDYPQNATFESVCDADEKVKRASVRSRPVILSAVGHVTYYRREALDAVGLYDETFSPGYEEEVDFCLRAGEMGFFHVVADDVFVYHKGSQSFDSALAHTAAQLREKHLQIIAERYPFYQKWALQAQTDETSALSDVIRRASSALLSREIAIDISFVDGSSPTGYQLIGAQIAHAMISTAQPDDRITLIVNDASHPTAFVEKMQKSPVIVEKAKLAQSQKTHFDIVYRPGQIFSEVELSFLQKIARRLVVHQLDFNLYAIPHLSSDFESWQRFRRLTERVLAVADGVTWNSHWVFDDAGRHGISAPNERNQVIYNGVDHLSNIEEELKGAPAKIDDRNGFLLVIGANYAYKNRVFAIRLLKALDARFGWKGSLIFAGPHMPNGNSENAERSELNRYPELSSRVIDLRVVSEPEKSWLMRHASLVLYPSLSEGFGLVPLEAGLADTPAITFASTSLSEVLGAGVFYLSSYNADEAVDDVWRLIDDDEARAKQIRSLKERAAQFTWMECARNTWAFIHRINGLPPRTWRATEIERPINDRWLKLKRDLRNRLRMWSNAYQRYGVRALWEEIRSYSKWRLSRLGLYKSKN